MSAYGSPFLANYGSDKAKVDAWTRAVGTEVLDSGVVMQAIHIGSAHNISLFRSSVHSGGVHEIDKVLETRTVGGDSPRTDRGSHEFLRTRGVRGFAVVDARLTGEPTHVLARAARRQDLAHSVTRETAGVVASGTAVRPSRTVESDRITRRRL